MKTSTKYIVFGFVLMVLAAAAFTSAIYYSWIAVTPGCDTGCNAMYNRTSTILAYGSYVVGGLSLLAFIAALLKRRTRPGMTQ